MIEKLIRDINKSLDNNCYFAALSLALILPDICGKAKYPADGVTKRYITWYNEYIGNYEKPTSKYNEDMPYLSGEVIYNLRNSFLHQGTPNSDKYSIKETDCKIDEFELVFCKNLLGHTSKVSYNGPNFSRNEIANRGYRVNVRLLCVRLCNAAQTYYNENKQNFNFFNYHIEDRDTE